MSNLETTEMKLKTTPTGGMSGEHSPYYRRLLSAGYKGFLQGSISGAGLYGVMGLVAGGLLAVAAWPFLGAAAALALIPACAGIGIVKGSSTFGNIGTVAAISAESADLAEQRRYLLDRYYELPDGPEGDKQAEAIEKMLATQTHTRQPHQLFHWRTVLICAAIGAALAAAIANPTVLAMFGDSALGHAMHALIEVVGHGSAVGIGAGFGAVAGATIGIDRHYIRTWFDGSEKLLHDDSHSWNALMERQKQIDLLKSAASVDDETKRIIDRQGNLHGDLGTDANAKLVRNTPTAEIQPPKPAIANLDTPDTRVSTATHQARLADIQKALEIPAI